MKQILPVIAAFFFIGTVVNGQSRSKHDLDSMRTQLQQGGSDSLMAVLRAAISLQLAETHPDSAMAMARQGIINASRARSKKASAECLESIGWIWFRTGSPDSAECYLNKSISLFHAAHDTRGESHALMNLTTIYDYAGNNEKVLDICLQAIRLMEGLQDLLGKAYAEEKIASCYIKQGLNDKAIPYLQDAIPVFRELHQDAFLAGALMFQGQICLSTRQYDSAIPKFRESAQAYNRSDFTAGEAAAIGNIATAFMEKTGQKLQHPWTDSALYYHQLAYQLDSTTGDSLAKYFERMSIGEALVLLGNFTKAIPDLEIPFRYFIKYKSPIYAYEASTWLSKTYKRSGDYKKAVDYMEQSAVFKDSVDATNRRETMANMFARYETDKKDKAIQLLNAQKNLADKELSRNKVIELFSFCLLALTLALAIVLRKQARIRQQLKEVKMRNQIAADLHDDIGSSLSSILLLSNMAASKEPGHEGKETFRKIGHTARDVMEKVGDIVWTMNPQNDGATSIKERIEKLALHMQEISGLHIDVSISDKLEEVKPSMELRKNIFLLCKEALNNIVKHANASCTGISIDLVQNQIHLNISDNGTGFDVNDHPRGNGLGLMAQRAKDCNGEYRIQSRTGEGTSIHITLPVPHSRYRFS